MSKKTDSFHKSAKRHKEIERRKKNEAKILKRLQKKNNDGQEVSPNDNGDAES